MSGATTPEIVGRSKPLQRALAMADRFAPTAMPILLVGPTGTGKEVFAKHIHRMSGRRGRFVPVNCGALPREMVESLLFGHRRGAFTGALEASIGFVEAADGGTLFLDELSSLSVEAQVKLLRVLETKEITPLGETRARSIDFRVVASAQGDLPIGAAAGPLRLDLYERVAGIVLEMLPLEERLEDIVPLAEHFVNLNGRMLEPAAVPILLNYSWPGNVRELRTAIERAGYLSENGTVGPDALAEAIALGAPTSVRSANEAGTAARGTDDLEQIISACEAHSWDAEQAAAALGVHRATLYRRLQEAGVSLRVLRSNARQYGRRQGVARSVLPPRTTQVAG